jgi:hypothetical protein
MSGERERKLELAGGQVSLYLKGEVRKMHDLAVLDPNIKPSHLYATALEAHFGQNETKHPMEMIVAAQKSDVSELRRRLKAAQERLEVSETKLPEELARAEWFRTLIGKDGSLRLRALREFIWWDATAFHSRVAGRQPTSGEAALVEYRELLTRYEATKRGPCVMRTPERQGRRRAQLDFLDLPSNIIRDATDEEAWVEVSTLEEAEALDRTLPDICASESPGFDLTGDHWASQFRGLLLTGLLPPFRFKTHDFVIVEAEVAEESIPGQDPYCFESDCLADSTTLCDDLQHRCADCWSNRWGDPAIKGKPHWLTEPLTDSQLTLIEAGSGSAWMGGVSANCGILRQEETALQNLRAKRVGEWSRRQWESENPELDAERDRLEAENQGCRRDKSGSPLGGWGGMARNSDAYFRKQLRRMTPEQKTEYDRNLKRLGDLSQQKSAASHAALKEWRAAGEPWPYELAELYADPSDPDIPDTAEDVGNLLPKNGQEPRGNIGKSLSEMSQAELAAAHSRQQEIARKIAGHMDSDLR